MSISAIMWIVWAIIGFCGGYMVSRLLLDGRLSLVLPLLGIVGGVLGGWVLTLILGVALKVMYLSLISALVGAALMLWLVWHIQRSSRKKDKKDGE